MEFWNLLLSRCRDIKVQFFRFLVGFRVSDWLVCPAEWWNTLTKLRITSASSDHRIFLSTVSESYWYSRPSWLLDQPEGHVFSQRVQDSANFVFRREIWQTDRPSDNRHSLFGLSAEDKHNECPTSPCLVNLIPGATSFHRATRTHDHNHGACYSLLSA